MTAAFELVPFPNWVPDEIVNGYYDKKVLGLFEWQNDVICDSNPLRNLVFSAPTSAGKSIVAELLALRVVLTGKRVLFVLPYISVAKEKLTFLQRLWRRVDVQVAGFIGPNSAPSRDWTAAVCTMEKANSLINHAIIDGNLHEYGLIVIDELHMVSDSSRGATLESLAAKILYHNNSCFDDFEKIRLIGMSATMTNINEVGTWLDAQVLTTTFRPVQLSESVSCDGVVRVLSNGNTLRNLETRFRYPGDLDCTVGFSVEAVAEKKLTLVFCSSKNEVEKVALDVARMLDSAYKSSTEMTSLLNREALWSLKLQLEQSCRQLDPVLAKTLPRGVAYHHAGLTSEERECIENGFRDGTIVVLVATSTLSSGVNLPANRVIIKAQIRGPAAINATTYGQMAGRAGRMGHTETGESILVAKACDMPTVLRIIRQGQTQTTGMKRDPSKLMLEGICSGLTPSLSSSQRLAGLLLFPSSKSPDQVVCELASQSLVTKATASTEGAEGDEPDTEVSLSATQLGRAALASSLPPDAALFVFADLQTATRALAIDTELHMLYLVTPVNCSVWQGCDWNHLHSLFGKLDAISKRVARMVGANERFLLSRLQGRSVSATDIQLQLHHRFFSALALFDLVCEMSLTDVAEKYRISRGALQSLQQQSATYAVMVVAFCSRLGWQYVRSLLEGFATRLAFGVRAELTELVRIEGIDGGRARIFHEHDITSLSQLAYSPISKVATVLSLAVPFESSNANDGMCEWLSGEERMTLDHASRTLIARAADAVRSRIRELGLDVDVNMLKPAGIVLATPEESATVVKSEEMVATQRILDRAASQHSQESIASQQEKHHFMELTQRGSVEVFDSPDPADEIVPSTPVRQSELVTDECYVSNVLASTPVGLRHPRPSLSCSRIDDSIDEGSIDLFADSMSEMTLDDDELFLGSPGPVQREVEVTTNDDVVEDSFDGEVVDLETSLALIGKNNYMLEGDEDENKENIPVLRHTSFVEEDSFDRSVHLVQENNASLQHKSFVEEDSFDRSVHLIPISDVNHRSSPIRVFEDSFDMTQVVYPVKKVADDSFDATQVLVPLQKTSHDCHASSPLILARRRSSLLVTSLRKSINGDISLLSLPSSPLGGDDDSANRSIDLFDSPVAVHSGPPKRNRTSQVFSPSLSSPLTKSSRLVVIAPTRPVAFPVTDVCRSFVTWNSFLTRSDSWQSVALSPVLRGNDVIAVALCHPGQTVDFLPLTEDYIPGCESEEAACPSSTPCQSIPYADRLDQLTHILSSCRIYAFEALRVAEALRKSIGVVMSTPVCISYLAFLGHMRQGDSALTLPALAAKFQWDYDVQALFRMNLRIRAAAQAFVLAGLYERLRSQAAKLSSEASLRLELGSLEVVSAMSLGGFPFNQSLCTSALSSMREEMDRLENECHRMAGKSFNLENPNVVSEVLYTRLRLPCPGGQTSNKRHIPTNKAVLEQMTSLHPIVGKIIRFRQLKFAVSHCLIPLAACVSSDNVIRASFEVCTATGRILSHRPNVQGVPKGDVIDGFCVRSLLCARPDYVLLTADYSQLELRVLAHLSEDRALIARLSDDARDIFAELSKQWGFPRDSVKTVCYGIIFGMGVRSLAEVTKTTSEEATRLMKMFFDSFPKVQSYINQTKEISSNCGFVTTFLGRRRVTCQRGQQDERARDHRQALNFTIQGTASEIFKQAILNIRDRIKDFDSRLVMTVHDEVIVECPSVYSGEVRNRIRDAMQSVFPTLRVPLRVKVSEGPSWGQLK